MAQGFSTWPIVSESVWPPISRFPVHPPPVSYWSSESGLAGRRRGAASFDLTLLLVKVGLLKLFCLAEPLDDGLLSLTVFTSASFKVNLREQHMGVGEIRILFQDLAKERLGLRILSCLQCENCIIALN